MRRPARLERAGALTPRDRIWSAIRCFGPGHMFSVAEIIVLSEQRVDTVMPYVEGLEKAGHIEAVKRSLAPYTCRRELLAYRLLRDVGVDAPRVGRDGKPIVENIAQQQMWNAMRAMKGDFDWRDLVQCCPCSPSMDTAKTYLKHLQRAHYIVVSIAPRGGAAEGRSRLPARYRFVRARDTGPRPPLVDRNKNVMDGNTGEIVYQGGKADADR